MSASPIAPDAEIYPDVIDPMLAAIRQSLVDATDGVLAEIGERQVTVVAPDETDQGIDAAIRMAMARNKGLAILLVAGAGKNPDPDAPGPRMTLTIEAQLFVSTRIRGRDATSPLELCGAIAKHYHHLQVRISGFPWHEEIRVTGFDPLPDPDFTAYFITLERDFQL